MPIEQRNLEIKSGLDRHSSCGAEPSLTVWGCQLAEQSLDGR